MKNANNQNQKGAALVPLLIALVAVLAGATGYFAFVRKPVQAPVGNNPPTATGGGIDVGVPKVSDGTNGNNDSGGNVVAPVNVLPNISGFIDSGYQLVYRSELDFDGDGVKEIAMVIFDPQAPDRPNCKGYCDDGYIIKVLKLDIRTSKMMEIYNDYHTGHETVWDKFETVRDENGKKDNLLLGFTFARTRLEYFLKWENGKIVKGDNAGSVAVPADWKTYRNEEHGFSFKYPKDWRVVSISSSSMKIQYQSSDFRDLQADIKSIDGFSNYKWADGITGSQFRYDSVAGKFRIFSKFEWENNTSPFWNSTFSGASIFVLGSGDAGVSSKTYVIPIKAKDKIFTFYHFSDSNIEDAALKKDVKNFHETMTLVVRSFNSSF